MNLYIVQHSKHVHSFKGSKCISKEQTQSHTKQFLVKMTNEKQINTNQYNNFGSKVQVVLTDMYKRDTF